MSRSFMKLFYRQNSEKERIEYVDESINQLVWNLMSSDNSNKRECYKSELKEIMIIRSNITDKPITSPSTKAIINGDNMGRAMIDYETGEWYIENIKAQTTILYTLSLIYLNAACKYLF